MNGSNVTDENYKVMVIVIVIVILLVVLCLGIVCAYFYFKGQKKEVVVEVPPAVSVDN